MSQTDSFIDEVTEEVRKDRLYRLMRRYGWLAVLAVLLIVGGAAYNEWTKAQDRAVAEALGDSIFAAIGLEEQDARAEALASIEAPTPESRAMIDLLAASELSQNSPSAAAERLLELADNPDVGTIYRQIATLKATALPGSGLSIEDRRTRLEGLALASGLTRLLAQEQLALIEAETGQAAAAIEALLAIVNDAEATAGLICRASQAIVALGGTLPEDADGA